MSCKGRSSMTAKRQDQAPVFAALGDATRLSLIAKLCNGQPRSISQLTQSSRLTRQAITKHLRVLENVGIVHSVRTGRESLFEFDPEPVEEIKKYLDLVSEQWDQALSRLRSFVERGMPVAKQATIRPVAAARTFPIAGRSKHDHLDTASEESQRMKSMQIFQPKAQL